MNQFRESRLVESVQFHGHLQTKRQRNLCLMFLEWLRTYALQSIMFECRGPFQSTVVDSAPKHSIRDPMHFPKHSIRGRPKHSIRPDQLLGSGRCQNHSIRGKACALDSCALEVTVSLPSRFREGQQRGRDQANSLPLLDDDKMNLEVRSDLQTVTETT